MKNDVAKLMPKKDEHVVFCRLSALQRQVYEDFLQSHDMQQIFEGRRDVLFGIDILRKICNHPDLLLPATNKTSSITQPTQSTSTHVSKSGKLQVLDSLLKLWHAEKHRVLVFSQSRRMLDILESVMRGYQYSYRRMDGSTPITARIPLVDEFNARPDIFVFLLTTRVGGLGVNLVGANRVLIFDPDWVGDFICLLISDCPYCTTTESFNGHASKGTRVEIGSETRRCHLSIDDFGYHRRCGS